MSYNLSVADIDNVWDNASCQTLVNEINSAGEKNRFKYPWLDDKNEPHYHDGTVTAKWADGDPPKCQIVFAYDDGEHIPVSFTGKNSLTYFVKQVNKFVWIHGEPKWFEDALKGAYDEVDVAEAIMQLKEFRSAAGNNN